MLHNIKLIGILLLLLGFSNMNSQDKKGIIGDENWLMNWTNFKPKQSNYRDSKIILTGQITKNTTLTKNNVYLLVGDVYVTNNAILTIEPGTIIRGDFESNGTLIITINSKILAEGTETDPIVFTSNLLSDRKAGDWGGIILLSDAPINKSEGVGSVDLEYKNGLCKFGGENENANSGILKYVRVEFSGKRFSKTKSLNAITLAGVGKKTVIENVMVSFANDDAIEIKGGNVNLNKIVVYKSVDDDFDISMGTQTHIDNSLIVRDPYLSEESKSRAFEIESFDKVDATSSSKLISNVQLNNITILNLEKENFISNTEAIYLNDNIKFKINNSVISGFKIGIALSNNAATNKELASNVKMKNIIFNNFSKIVDAETTYSENGNFSAEIESVILSNNVNYKKTNVPFSKMFRNIDLKALPDFRISDKENFVFEH